MVLWKDRPVDDGAAYTSEAALRPIADAVVWDAVRALRRAFREGSVERQWRAEALLELARLLRMDLRSGAWGRLEPGERRQLRRALVVLSHLTHGPAEIPIA